MLFLLHLDCSRKLSDVPHSRFRWRGLKLCMLTGFLIASSFDPPPNLHTCISLVEVDRFGQSLGRRYLPMSIFYSLACFRAFNDAAHSGFWRQDPKLCLLDVLKMLVLALPYIYSRVF